MRLLLESETLGQLEVLHIGINAFYLEDNRINNMGFAAIPKANQLK